jgi:hypothetical protein
MTRLSLALLAALFAAAPAAAQSTLTPAPKSVFDGVWKGMSDGGACNAPLDIQLSIEYGFVEGTAFDTSARGPVPNPSKAAPPAPTPGLWQLHGTAHGADGFTLVTAASVTAVDRRGGKMTVRRDGAGLVLTEDSGCKRTARLTR